MNLDDALHLLHLSDDGAITPTDIEHAFRRQARNVHPDAGGSRTDWDALKEAQQVALHHYDEAGAELAVQTLRELVRANRSALELAQRREETADTKHAVVRRRTSSLMKARRLTWGFTTASAIALALYKLLEAFAAAGGGPEATPRLFDAQTIFFTLSISIIGLIGLLFKIRADRIAQAVEDLIAELGDHEIYSQLKDEIEQYGGADEGAWWSIGQLEGKVGCWINARLSGLSGPGHFIRTPFELPLHLFDAPSLVAIARRIGDRDATRIVLRKGLEIGAIRPSRESLGLYAWSQQA